MRANRTPKKKKSCVRFFFQRYVVSEPVHLVRQQADGALIVSDELAGRDDELLALESQLDDKFDKWQKV